MVLKGSNFHLAIPSKDIQESIEFYRSLGCEIGRLTNQFAIINFQDVQVVCHKVDEIEQAPQMYPRHFGIIIKNNNHLYREWVKHVGKPYVFEELFHRYKGKPEEHTTFFLKDPSNNLIEFKWYKNQELIFGVSP